jgi:hypothetical protein
MVSPQIIDFVSLNINRMSIFAIPRRAAQGIEAEILFVRLGGQKDWSG